MNCDEIRENLSAYQDGELDPAAASKVEAHVAACGSCARALADFRMIFDSLGAGPVAAPSQGFAQRVMNSISAEETSASLSRRPWIRVAAAAAAVALIAAGLFIAAGNGGSGPSAPPVSPAATGHVSFDDVVAAVKGDPALLDILDHLEELEMIEVLESLPILERMDDLQSPGADAIAAAAAGAVIDPELPLEDRD